MGVFYLRNSSHASDQQNLPDIAQTDFGVLEGLLAGCNGPLDEGIDDILKLGTRQLHVEMPGSGSVHRQVRQIDVGLQSGRQLTLGLLRRLSKTLHGHIVLGDINALLQHFKEDINHSAIFSSKIHTAKEMVTLPLVWIPWRSTAAVPCRNLPRQGTCLRSWISLQTRPFGFPGWKHRTYRHQDRTPQF